MVSPDLVGGRSYILLREVSYPGGLHSGPRQAKKSIVDTIDVGKEVCHDLRIGAQPHITTFKEVDNKPITPGVGSGTKTDNAASLPM
jgi:hypothetical protein